MKVIRAIFFAAFVALRFVAHAQSYNSTPLFFTTDEIKGCAPLKVNIKAPSCSPCTILHDVNDPSSKGKSINGTDTDIAGDTLIYSKPGNYTMVIVSGTSNYTISITVLPNYSPTFDVYACSGNKVYFKVTDTHYDGIYTVDYPANPPDPTPKTESSGTSDILNLSPSTAARAISVRGKYSGGANNCLIKTKTVVAQNTIAVPVITQLEAISSSQLNLNFSEQPSVLYKLEIAVNNATGFQLLQNVYDTAAVALKNNIKPDDNFYCFRMAAVDYCAGSPGSYSLTVCSINFDAVAKNNQNVLTWSTSPTGINDYTLTRNKTVLPPNPKATDVTKIDNSVICTTDYTYQLTSNYFVGKSISLPKIVTAFSADVPPVVNNITTAVHNTGAGVDISWPPGTQPKFYSIIRSPSDIIGTSTIPQFADDAYTNATDYCYKIKYNNICNNTSAESIEACPIHLSGSVQKDNIITLSWSAYKGWKNGVARYTVEKYTTTGQFVQSFNMGTSTSLTDDVQDLTTQAYVYFVNAYANDAGLSTTVSNSLTLIKQPNLFYPSAFTPNSDELNDKFKVFGQYISKFEMEIFNRWGELLFSTDKLTEGWDGTYKGIAMPEGTYAFVAKITDSAGRTFKRSGSIMLLHKK